jgi:hypothetical protein
MSISTPERLSPRGTDPADRTSHDPTHDPSQRQSFAGWRWMAVWPAFPVAGYIGRRTIALERTRSSRE